MNQQVQTLRVSNIAPLVSISLADHHQAGTFEDNTVFIISVGKHFTASKQKNLSKTVIILRNRDERTITVRSRLFFRLCPFHTIFQKMNLLGTLSRTTG